MFWRITVILSVAKNLQRLTFAGGVVTTEKDYISPNFFVNLGQMCACMKNYVTPLSEEVFLRPADMLAVSPEEGMIESINYEDLTL